MTLYVDDWCKDGSFDTSLPSGDRNSLMRQIARFIEWSDRTVAHPYPREDPPAVPPPTFGELDAAIDLVSQVYVKYWILLDGTLHALDLLVVDPTWENVFANPLFPDWTEDRP